jgi:hypothetical protein
VVFGGWAWRGRAPWKRLPEDPAATTLTPEDIEEAVRVMTSGMRPVYAKLEPPVTRTESVKTLEIDGLPGGTAGPHRLDTIPLPAPTPVVRDSLPKR